MTQPQHLSLPLRLRGHRMATHDQDSIDDVVQCARVVLTTPAGSRDELPEFGMADQVFRLGGPDPAEAEDVLAQWEPRADASVRADDTDLAEGIGRLIVEVSGDG